MNVTRKERRAYLKYLKKNDPKAYLEAKKDIKKIGKDLHRRHVSEQMRKNEETLSELERKRQEGIDKKLSEAQDVLSEELED